MSFSCLNLSHSCHCPLPKFEIFSMSYTTLKGFPGGSVVKNPPASSGDAEDTSSNPGMGRSPGVGNGNLQYSCLENSKDRGACGPQSMDSQTVRHNWAHTYTLHWIHTELSFSNSFIEIFPFLCYLFLFLSVYRIVLVTSIHKVEQIIFNIFKLCIIFLDQFFYKNMSSILDFFSYVRMRLMLIKVRFIFPF